MTFPLWSILPFICLLASIAIVPLVFRSWWVKNSNKLLLSLALSIPVLAVVLPNSSGLLIESLTDYFSFIVLL
ncbi:MAG TPA: sodium:proton antiporter, partial [Terriglobia bacterium]|nr:sodium:proton antiporter [Terriglobia bacterium]